MTLTDTLIFLKDTIHKELLPLINSNYVLWDLPYYSNIGDILIWQGELDFLKNIPHKCIGIASKESCTFPDLSSDTIILLQGGGNFGDLWRDHQKFRLEVIRRYPHNKIIIFPQSIYYENKKNAEADANLMAENSNLVICARDRISYEYLKQNFKENKILLVPDMAFCILSDHLNCYRKPKTDKILFLKRKDKELSEDNISFHGVEIRDWPSIEKRIWWIYLFEKAIGFNWYFKKCKLNILTKEFSRILDCYGNHILRPYLIKMGIRFISAYKYVYTTRLHVMILSLLLEKECEFLDNSYGKNSAFYETWLKNLREVKKYSQ